MTATESNFNRDKFLIDLKENYAIYDESDKELFYIDVPWRKRGREITLYDDDEQRNPILLIRKDDHGKMFNLCYTVKGPDGSAIARLCRFKPPLVGGLSGDNWNIENEAGESVAQAREGPTVQCLIRWALGQFYFVELLRRLVKTDYRLIGRDSSGSDVLLGLFNRRGHSPDDYLLDLSADRDAQLDRRVALATALVLSKGEGVSGD